MVILGNAKLVHRGKKGNSNTIEKKGRNVSVSKSVLSNRTDQLPLKKGASEPDRDRAKSSIAFNAVKDKDNHQTVDDVSSQGWGQQHPSVVEGENLEPTYDDNIQNLLDKLAIYAGNIVETNKLKPLNMSRPRVSNREFRVILNQMNVHLTSREALILEKRYLHHSSGLIDIPSFRSDFKALGIAYLQDEKQRAARASFLRVLSAGTDSKKSLNESGKYIENENMNMNAVPSQSQNQKQSLKLLLDVDVQDDEDEYVNTQGSSDDENCDGDVGRNLQEVQREGDDVDTVQSGLSNDQSVAKSVQSSINRDDVSSDYSSADNQTNLRRSGSHTSKGGSVGTATVQSESSASYLSTRSQKSMSRPKLSVAFDMSDDLLSSSQVSYKQEILTNDRAFERTNSKSVNDALELPSSNSSLSSSQSQSERISRGNDAYAALLDQEEDSKSRSDTSQSYNEYSVGSMDGSSDSKVFATSSPKGKQETEEKEDLASLFRAKAIRDSRVRARTEGSSVVSNMSMSSTGSYSRLVDRGLQSSGANRGFTISTTSRGLLPSEPKPRPNLYPLQPKVVAIERRTESLLEDVMGTVELGLANCRGWDTIPDSYLPTRAQDEGEDEDEEENMGNEEEDEDEESKEEVDRGEEEEEDDGGSESNAHDRIYPNASDQRAVSGVMRLAEDVLRISAGVGLEREREIIPQDDNRDDDEDILARDQEEEEYEEPDYEEEEDDEEDYGDDPDNDQLDDINERRSHAHMMAYALLGGLPSSEPDSPTISSSYPSPYGYAGPETNNEDPRVSFQRREPWVLDDRGGITRNMDSSSVNNTGKSARKSDHPNNQEEDQQEELRARSRLGKKEDIDEDSDDSYTE